MARRMVRWTAMIVSLGFPLSACQSFLPRDDTPTVLPRLAAAPDAGPSTQRRDEKGYPMIGAYPTAATAQATNEEVAETRARFANVEARSTGSTDPAYRRNVAELQGLAATQQDAAAKALTPAPADAASSRAQ